MEENNNKYYIPEIEEFHVGYEYEYITKNTKIWTQEIFDLMDADFMEMIIDNKTCRVKYIDQSDIEELGWIYPCKIGRSGNPTKYKNGNYEIRLIENQIYSICDLRIKEGYNKTIFLGTIKNKSELKRLMKQLNII